MRTPIWNHFQQRMQDGKKCLAVLIDPDKSDLTRLSKCFNASNSNKIDYVFVGGSVLESGNVDETIADIKSLTQLPIVLFPGDIDQISANADALLLLSLLSGRNPHYLIGKHVEAAHQLKASNLELIPASYILVDGGNTTTVQRVSETQPIHPEDVDLIVATALAGQQMGKKVTYLDAGSGAMNSISQNIIQRVKQETTAPLIVGGGIRTIEGIHQAWNAGADIVVIGNRLEADPHFLDHL